MIFVSHANPEDNDCSKWLALQLAKDGYGVWCDLTKLLGGENFWKDAEEAIRTRTIKFLYVLSRTSNEKDGPRNELQIAKNVAREKSLHDFIIPLHIDNLPHSEINVLLTSINAVPFEKSWADGYDQLVKVLQKESVPKKSGFNAAAVTSWWRSQASSEIGLKQERTSYLSNLLPITSMPKSVCLHTLVRDTPGPIQVENRMPFPGFVDGIDLVTFASADDMQPALGTAIRIIESNAIPVSDLLNGTRLETKKGRYFVSRLLRDSWERWIASTGLRSYSLSNKSTCYFFKKGDESNLDIHFRGVSGKQTYRSVVGFATQPDGSKRHWHFGIQARPVGAPLRAYVVSSHVLFTNDGVTPWLDPKKMHRARRRQCKQWFNEEWRDRLLATLHWLSQGEPSLLIQVGTNERILVSSQPQQFETDIDYSDPPTRRQRELLADVAETAPSDFDESDDFGDDDEEEDSE